MPIPPLFSGTLKSCRFHLSVFLPAAASLSPSNLLLLICEGSENPRELKLYLHADGEHTGSEPGPKRVTGAETENAELLGVWHLFKDLFLWGQRGGHVFWRLEDSVKYGESVLSIYCDDPVYSQVLGFIPVKWNDGIAEFQINETLAYLVFTILCVFELNDIVILPVTYLKILQHKQCETGVCVCVCVCAHFILHPRGCPLTSEVPSSGTHTSLVSFWQTLDVCLEFNYCYLQPALKSLQLR